MTQEILDCLNINTSFSCSGREDAHQGLDFILEEYNRNIKKHVSGVASSNKWEIVIKNFDNLEIFSKKTKNLLGIHDHHTQPKQVNNFTEERDNFRIKIRRSNYFKPNSKRCISGLNQSADKMSQNVLTFTTSSLGNMRIFFLQIFCCTVGTQAL